MIDWKELKLRRKRRQPRNAVISAAESVAQSVQGALGNVQGALGTVAGSVENVMTSAGGVVAPVAGGVASRATDAVSQGASTVRDWQHGGQRLLSDSLDGLRSARKDAQREARVARKQAELAARRADLQAMRTLVRHEHKLSQLDTRVERLLGQQGSSGSGRTVWLAGLLAGGYYLARHPQARSQVLNFVGEYSPALRDRLHQAGRQVSQLVGQVWIEREEPSSLVQQARQTTQESAKGAQQATKAVGNLAQDVTQQGREITRDTGRSLKS